MFNTIVVGHDGSPAADAAFRFAQQLAADDARLLLARVEAAGPVLARALPRGHSATGPLPLLPGAEARELRGHSVEHALAALAAQEDAGLIVVGSDRRHGDYRAHLVLGLRLLRHTACAVAIAPAADEDGEIRRIGVAYDGSPESEVALDAAYELAQRLHAAVTLYLAVVPNVYSSPDRRLAHREAGALLDAAAARAPQGVNPATVTVTGSASTAIAESTASICDLIVLGSRRQGALRRALDRSTSQALAVELDRAVLIAPRPGFSSATPDSGPRSTPTA